MFLVLLSLRSSFPKLVEKSTNELFRTISPYLFQYERNIPLLCSPGIAEYPLNFRWDEFTLTGGEELIIPQTNRKPISPNLVNL